MKKKLLVLFGSPHKNGITQRVLTQFISLIDKNNYEISIIYAYEQNMRPCIDCKACLKGLCPFNQKDDYAEILEQMKEADVIVIASPVYFFGFSAPLKAIIDRAQQFFQNKPNKQAVFHKSALGLILYSAGSNHTETKRSMELAGEMFFRSVTAKHIGCIGLENTDNEPNGTVDFSDIESYF